MKKTRIASLWLASLATMASATVPFVMANNGVKKQNNTSNLESSTATSRSGETNIDLSGKTITSADMNNFINTYYKDGINVNGSIIPNVFSEMNLKFPQEFFDYQLGVYKENAAPIFKKMVEEHPEFFIQGLPSGWTGTITTPNFWSNDISFALAPNATNPNLSSGILQIDSTILFQQDGYYFRGLLSVKITDMIHAKTEVNAWASNSFNIPDGNSLSKHIPSEVINEAPGGSLKKEIQNLVKTNLHHILNNVPLTTELTQVDNPAFFDITQNESDPTAVNIKFTINKYAGENGKLIFDTQTFGLDNASELKKIILRGFLKPRKPTSPKTITELQLNSIAGVAGTPWENISNKYSNDFVNNTKFNKEAVDSITSIINAPTNAANFFENPVQNTKGLPIVKANSIRLELINDDKGVDYSKLKIVGEFLSISENPSIDISSSSYRQMSIIVNGFRTEPTKVKDPGVFSVASDSFLSKLIPSEVAAKGVSALQTFLTTNINNGTILDGFAQDTIATIDNPSHNIVVTPEESGVAKDRVTVTFRVNKAYSVGGVPDNTSDKTFTIILNGFTQPNSLLTTGKTVSITALGEDTHEISIIALRSMFAVEISPTIMSDSSYQDILSAFVKTINAHPELYFDNPAKLDNNNDGVVNSSDLPIVQAGSTIFLEPTINEATSKYTNLSLTGKFLCKPDNVNNPSTVADYKDLKITITGFKEGQTIAKNDLPATGELKKILAGQADSPANALAIQEYINSGNNITKILDNTIFGSIKTTAVIDQDGSGKYLIKALGDSDPTGISIVLRVSNYIDSNCNLDRTGTTTIKVTMSGFDNNVAGTTAKTLTAYNLSNWASTTGDGKYNYFRNLQNKIAMDLVSVGSPFQPTERKGWGGEGPRFVKELVTFINDYPSYFFNNPVSVAESGGRSYVQAEPNWEQGLEYPDPTKSPLKVEIMPSNVSLKITGKFLVRGEKLSEPVTYQTRSIEIISFNADATIANPITPRITDYVYNDASGPIILKDKTAQEFSGSMGEQLANNILKDYIKTHMNDVFKNISCETQLVSCTQPRVYFNNSDPTDEKNNKSITTDARIKFYVKGNGVIETNTSVTSTIRVIITGFKPPKDNVNMTAVKTDITADTIYDFFTTGEKTGFATLKDIGNNYVFEYSETEGFLGTEFLNDITDAINMYPELFFDNPIPPELRNGLPIVRFLPDKLKNDIHVSTTYPTNTSTSIPGEIIIKGSFLCQPKILNQQATEADYQELTIKIANGVKQDFVNNHQTSLNPKNITSDGLDINNPVFIGGQETDLAKLTIDDIANDHTIAQDAIKEFANRYKGQLFNNISKNETTVVSAILDQNDPIDYNSRSVLVNLKIRGIVSSSGLFEPTAETAAFRFYIRGFKDPTITIQKDNDKTLLTYAAGGSCVLAVLLLTFIILYKRNSYKKKNIKDEQFDSFF